MAKDVKDSVLLSEEEASRLTEALELMPDGKARTADGAVRYATLDGTLEALRSEDAQVGDVVVYRDLAYFCEQAGGREWSAFKLGEDGSWAMVDGKDDASFALGPFGSHDFARMGRREAAWTVCDEAAKRKDKLIAHSFPGEDDPFDLRSRALAAMPGEVALEPDAVDLYRAVDSELRVTGAVDRIVEGAHEALEDGAAPEEVADLVRAGVRREVGEFALEAAREEGVRVDSPKVDLALETTSRRLVAGDLAAALDEASAERFPLERAVEALDGPAWERSEAYAEPPLSLAEVEGREDFADLGLEPHRRVEGELARELEAGGWVRSLDESGREVLQAAEPTIAEGGVKLHETLVRDGEGWRYAGLCEAGKSDLSLRAEEFAQDPDLARDLSSLQTSLALREPAWREEPSAVELHGELPVNDRAQAQEPAREAAALAAEQEVPREQAVAVEHDEERTAPVVEETAPTVDDQAERRAEGGIEPERREGAYYEAQEQAVQERHEEAHDESQAREERIVAGGAAVVVASEVTQDGGIVEVVDGDAIAAGTNVEKPGAALRQAPAVVVDADPARSERAIAKAMEGVEPKPAPKPARLVEAAKSPAEERARLKDAPKVDAPTPPALSHGPMAR